MGDIVSEGTYFTCDKCAGILKMSVSSSSSQGDSKKLATTSNFALNPEPGSQCMLVPSSPTPCSPPSVIVKSAGQSAVEIDGSPALGADCQLQCAKSGNFSLAISGQSVAQHDGAEEGKKIEELIAGSTIFVPLELQESQVEKSEPAQTTKDETPPQETETHPSSSSASPEDEDRDTYPSSSYNALRLKNQYTATEIANGHATKKHLGEFQGIASNQAEFEQHIFKVLNDPKSLMRGPSVLRNERTAVWHPDTETVVIINPRAKDRGTCFKPRDKYKYFAEDID